MLSVDVANRVTRGAVASLNFPSEEVSLNHLVGRVLSEPIFSVRKQPPFDRVAMDGIAISYKTYENYRDGGGNGGDGENLRNRENLRNSGDGDGENLRNRENLRNSRRRRR